MPVTRHQKSRTGEKALSSAESSARQAVSAVWLDRRSRYCSISSWLKWPFLSASAADPRRASGSSRTRASVSGTGLHLRSACPPPVSALPAQTAACARVLPRSYIHRLCVHRFSGLRHRPTAGPGRVGSTVPPFSDVRGLAELTLAPSGFPGRLVVHVAS